MVVEKIENGYIVTYGLAHTRRCCHSLLDVFKFMLLDFEGKSEGFGGNSYAKVIIEVSK